MAVSVITAGYTVVAREPADILVELVTPRGHIFVPVKELTFKKTQSMTSEHASGTALPYHLTDGAIDYEGEFSVGAWFMNEANHDQAEQWEELLYYYLERPYDEGRPVEFHIYLHEREYPSSLDSSERDAGGQIWMTLRRCKLTGDSFAMSESGSVKRTYPFKFLRREVGPKAEMGGFMEDAIINNKPKDWSFFQDNDAAIHQTD